MKAVVLVGILLGVAPACAIDHRSDDYACATSRDCNGGRTCVDNACVLASSIDASSCPSNCTSCNMVAHTCTIDCAAATANCAAKVVCPAGWNCNVKCDRDGSCRNGVSCASTTSCVVECSGQNSCQDVACGTGACSVNCSGTQSCRNVSCGSSCACDVKCSGPQSCTSGSVRCAPGCIMLNPPGCTSLGVTCHSC